MRALGCMQSGGHRGVMGGTPEVQATSGQSSPVPRSVFSACELARERMRGLGRAGEGGAMWGTPLDRPRTSESQPVKEERMCIARAADGDRRPNLPKLAC